MSRLIEIQQTNATFNKGREVGPNVEDYIKNNFRYDYKTGIITRLDRKHSNGSLDKDGYLIIKIKGKQYKAHRLAWFLYYGRFPQKEIDHINRKRTDNRIENLRESTRMENVQNTRLTPNTKTGVVGVYIDQYTKGLKKRFTTKVKDKTYRFYSLADAIKFRKQHGYAV